MCSNSGSRWRLRSLAHMGNSRNSSDTMPEGGPYNPPQTHINAEGAKGPHSLRIF